MCGGGGGGGERRWTDNIFYLRVTCYMQMPNISKINYVDGWKENCFYVMKLYQLCNFSLLQHIYTSSTF